MVRKFLPKYDFEIYNIQTGVNAWFLKRETAFVIGAANYGGQYIPVRRTSYTNCANTMRLRKHNATTQTQKQSVRNFLLLSMLVCMPIS